MTENEELIQLYAMKGSNIQTEKKLKRSNLGEYLIKGGPGRPVGEPQ